MVMLSWAWSKPSSEQQQQHLRSCKSGEFNYASEYGGATSELPLSEERLEAMKRDGYVINHSRVRIGNGQEDAYDKAKKLLQDWRHFQLGWAFVPSDTRIQQGQKFCVSSRELFTWITNPLQIRYIDDRKSKQAPKMAYAFGSGTLQGHLLAGEERFAVEWNKEDNSIWYEIFSFSKPAHLLSFAASPYVHFKQRLFAKHSADKMIQEMQKESAADLKE